MQPHPIQELQKVSHVGDDITALQKFFCWYLVDTELVKVLEMGWWSALGENISALFCFFFSGCRSQDTMKRFYGRAQYQLTVN